MTHDAPGPPWESYETPDRPRGEPEPGPRRGRAVLAGVAVAVVAVAGLAVAHHHSASAPAPESVISEQGYAALLTALRAGPGTAVTGVYLYADFAQVHVLKDGRDQMWSFSPDEGLRLQNTSRATDAGRSFDAAGFDGARLADACATAAQDVESTPDRCTVDIGPVDRLAHPAWVEVIFGAYTAYFDRAVRPTYPADS